jgi:putative glutamine amidotransferase
MIIGTCAIAGHGSGGPRHTSGVGRPRIAITPWRRLLPTFLGERTDLYTLDVEYGDAVRAAGGVPLILAVPEDPSDVEDFLDGVDGLLLSGGEDVDPILYGQMHDGRSRNTNPRRDRTEMALARTAVERRLPVLGVCRGLQLLNVAFGGSLLQDVARPESPHPPNATDPEEVLAQRHPITIAPGSRLARLYGAERRVVNTMHHQAIDRMADAFVPVAWSDDGLVEAIEPADPAGPVLAVQWHPERQVADGDQVLFDDFVDRARSARGTLGG